jgi:hypothetical protein
VEGSATAAESRLTLSSAMPPSVDPAKTPYLIAVKPHTIDRIGILVLAEKSTALKPIQCHGVVSR